MGLETASPGVSSHHFPQYSHFPVPDTKRLSSVSLIITTIHDPGTSSEAEKIHHIFLTRTPTPQIPDS